MSLIEKTSPGEAIYSRPPITIERLFGGSVPRQRNYDWRSRDVEATYYTLSRIPLTTTLFVHDQEAEVQAIGPRIDGKTLTYLLHFAAPSKAFGVDVGDIIKDWDKLYTDPANAKRLAAHRKMAGWSEYEAERLRLLRTIETGYGGDPNNLDYVVPVIRLKLTDEGVSWNLDPLDEAEPTGLKRLPDGSIVRLSEALPILGPLLAAAYSPSATFNWGFSRSYKGKAKDNGSQNMGSTQVLPLTIGLAPTLLETSLIRNLVYYVRTGRTAELPRP